MAFDFEVVEYPQAAPPDQQAALTDPTADDFDVEPPSGLDQFEINEVQGGPVMSTSDLVEQQGFSTRPQVGQSPDEKVREELEKAKVKRWYSSETGFAGTGGESMIAPSENQQVRIDEVLDTLPELMKDRAYLQKTAWQMSLTGSVMRGSFDVELDQAREDRLSITDKIGRTALALGPDFWLLGLGGTIPAIGNAAGRAVPLLRSAPLFANEASAAVRSGASFGFFEGIRRMYYEKFMAEKEGRKPDFLKMLGGSLYDTVKGYAMGNMFGAGHEARAKILENAKDPIMGFVKASGFLVPEATAIATVQSQLHNPLVLPGKDEFATSLGLILGMELFGGVRRLGTDLGNLSASNAIVGSLKEAYVRNARHPYSVAVDSSKDITVLEDLLNQDTTRIRAYEKAGGIEPEVPPLQASLDVLKQDLRAGRFVPDVEPVKQATAGAAPPATSTPSQPPAIRVLVQPPAGVDMPIPLFQGDRFEVIDLPNGKKVMVPIDSANSLALSTSGLIELPTMISWATKLFGFGKEQSIRARDTKTDMDLRSNEGTILGYFSSASRERQLEIRAHEKELVRLQRDLRKEARRGHNTAQWSERIADITKKVDSLKTDELRADEGKIVMNRILSAGPVERQLLTMTHEIGHLLSYFSRNWEQWKTTGLADNFLTTLVSFPKMFQEILDHAQKNGLNMQDIWDEGAFVSRLWRPAAKDLFMISDYRTSGAEMIADVVSVYIQKPELIHEYAPSLMSAMEVFWQSRPEMKQRFAELTEYVTKEKDPELVTSLLKEGFQTAEDVKLQAEQAGAAPREHTISGAEDKILSLFLDKMQPVLKHFKRNDRIRNVLERMQHGSAVQRWYTENMKKRFAEPLRLAGLKEDDIGLILFFNRVSTDEGRADLFNALGIDSVYARKQLSARLDLVQQQTAGKLQNLDMDSLLREFHEVRKDTVLKLMKESQLYDDATMQWFFDNSGYVRFDDLRHYVEAVNAGAHGGSGMGGRVLTPAEVAKARPSVGSLGRVRNPMAATIEQDMYIVSSVLKTQALKTVVNELRATGVAPAFTPMEIERISRFQPELLRGYLRNELRQVQFPERIWNEKLGRNIVELREYLVPEAIYDAFYGKPDAITTFFSEIATQSFGELASSTVKAKGAADTTRKLVRTGVKGVMKTNAAFRSFAVVFNAGFQVANLLFYDPARTFANAPKTKLRIEPTDSALMRNAKQVYNASPFAGHEKLAWYMVTEGVDRMMGSLKGELSPRSMKILERGLMSEGTRFTEDPTDTTVTERLLSKYGPQSYAVKVNDRAYGLLDKTGQRIRGLFDTFYNVAEGISKQAGLRYMEEAKARGELNLNQDAIEHIVRTQLGAPAYGRKGSWSTAMNTISPFIGAIKEGIRGDAEAFARNKPEWMLRATMLAVVPGVVQGLMQSGVFDDEEDQVEGMASVLGKQSTRSLEANFHIPQSVDEEGKGVSLRIPAPQSPVYRIMYAVSQRMTRAIVDAYRADPNDPELRDAYEHLNDLAGSILFGTEGFKPNLSPALTMPREVGDILLRGNVYDDYFKDMKYGDNELNTVKERITAAIDTAAKDMAVWKSLREPMTWAEDLRHLFAPEAGATESSLSRAAQLGTSFPFGSEMYNRFISHSDAGVREQGHRIEERNRSARAVDVGIVDEEAERLFGLNEKGELNREEIGKTVNKVQDLNVTSAVIKGRLKKTGIKHIENPYLRNFLDSGTMGAKEAWYNAAQADAKNPDNKNAAVGVFLIEAEMRRRNGRRRN